MEISYKFFKKTIVKFLPINIASKNFITHNYKVDENKIKINPLGYERFKKINKIEINKLRKKFHFSENDIVIFNSGKMNEEKKIIDLLRLLEILLKYNKKFRLLLVGQASGEYSKKIKKKIINLNSKFKDVIKWLGFQNHEKLRSLMSMTDIAIWPGIPSISIQESLYCDNILFLPKKSTSYHLITDENLTFYNDNILKTAFNILKIFKNKDLKKKIIFKNTIKINELNWNSITNKLIEIYKIN